MNIAALGSSLRTLAIAAAMAFAVIGGSLPVSAQGVTPPANWPEGAPLAAGAGQAVSLTNEEINFYTANLAAAVRAGIIGQAGADALLNEAVECSASADCADATKTRTRDRYIERVLDNVERGILPSGNTGDLPGTGEDDTAGETPGVTDAETPPLEDDCSLVSGNILNCIGHSVGKFIAVILWAIVSIFAWMLGIIGMFFNWVMVVTVFQYGTYFGNSEGILVAWSILRDLGNILLLFGFIFIGLQTILNIGHFSVGKALPRLVIFAILINFSLFVSEAIVDTSNVFASAFYNLASEGDCTRAENNAECMGYGISGKVLQAAGITSFFSTNGMSSVSEIMNSTDGWREMMIYAGYSIFLLVLMIALGAAAIMFVIRAITLMILLVLSPLGFAGMALPQFEEQSGKWWKTLISQAFFAPLYLLFILIALKIMDGVNDIFNSGGTSMLTALGDTNISAGGIFVIFALMTGFLIAAMQLAKNMGAFGANFAVNTATAATVGTMGFVGRRTIGEASSRLGQSIEKNKFFQKHAGLSRMALAVTDAGTNASFDLRQSGAVKGLAKSSHYDLGGPSKAAAHGMHGIHEKANKDREAWEKRQKKTDAEGMVGEAAQHELDHINEQKEEKLAPKKDAVRKQAEKVNKMMKNVKTAEDEKILRQQQNLLADLQKDYVKAQTDFENTKTGLTKRNEKTGKIEAVTYGDRIKELNAQKKKWNDIGDADKNTRIIAGYEKSAENPAMYWTAGPHADHEAVGRIRKYAGLDSTAKALKEIENAIKKAGGDTADAIHHEGKQEAKRDNEDHGDHAH